MDGEDTNLFVISEPKLLFRLYSSSPSSSLSSNDNISVQKGKGGGLMMRKLKAEGNEVMEARPE